jgi:hypothetical protein
MERHKKFYDASCKVFFNWPKNSVALALFRGDPARSGSNTGRDRTFHFHQLPDFAQPRSETTWLEPRARANRLKICVIIEEKFLSFSLDSQAPVAPIFYR